MADAEKFCLQYPNISDTQTTAANLWYYRYKKSLPQREIADYAGISRSFYIHFETPKHDDYPIDVLLRIAQVLGVEIIDLLDGYNRFLYDGQGRQLRAVRKQLHLTQSAFGKLHKVSENTVERRKNESIRMTKPLRLRVFAHCGQQKQPPKPFGGLCFSGPQFFFHRTKNCHLLRFRARQL